MEKKRGKKEANKQREKNRILEEEKMRRRPQNWDKNTSVYD